MAAAAEAPRRRAAAELDAFMTGVAGLRRAVARAGIDEAGSDLRGDAPAVQEGNSGDHSGGNEQAIKQRDRVRREVGHPRRDLGRRARRGRCARCSRRRTFRSFSARSSRRRATTLPYDAIYAQPGLLYDAGVKFAFSTGNGSNARHVAFHAALAVAYGLPPEGALKALTIWPAEIFGADKEIGAIAQGKLANLFITTGDPLRSSHAGDEACSSRGAKCRTTIGTTGCISSTKPDRCPRRLRNGGTLGPPLVGRVLFR